MSHRDRSIANMRCEAKRIYNQRRYINKLEKDKKELEQRIDKAISYINDMCLCSTGYFDYGDDLSPKHIVDILKGGNNG